MDQSISEKLKQLQELFPEAFESTGILNLNRLLNSLNHPSTVGQIQQIDEWSFNQILFDNNPFPCWIIDSESLDFIEVNNAAIEYYGYSREEFLDLNIRDIRPPDEMSRLLESIEKNIVKYESNNYSRHIKKGGQIAIVDIVSFEINYKGRKARHSQINDVSRYIKVENRIDNQDFWLEQSQRIGKIGTYSFDIVSRLFTSSITLDEILGIEHRNPKNLEDWVASIHPDDEEMMINYLSELLISKEKFNKEYRVRHADGKILWVSGLGDIICDENNLPLKMIGTIQDITERKNNDLKRLEIEQKVKDSEKRLKEVQRTAKIGHWELNLQTNELYWSDEVYNIFEFDLDITPSYDIFLARIHPDDRDSVNNAYHNSLINKEIYSIDHRVLLDNGDIKYVTERCVTEYSSEGVAIISKGTVQDITVRKALELESQKNYELYKSLLKISPDLTIISDLSFNVLMASENTYSVFGIDKKKDITQLNMLQFLHPDEKELAILTSKRRMQGLEVGNPVYRIIDANNTIRFVEVNADFIRDKVGNPTQIMLVLRDITDRKLEEQEKLLITEKYRDLFENAPIGYFEIDKNGKIIALNKAILDLTGYTKEELIGNYCWNYSLSPQKSKSKILDKIKAADLANESLEAEIKNKNGKRINILVNYKIFKSIKGEVIGIRINIQDITAWKIAEDSLRESEAHFKSITETSDSAIITINPKGNIVYLNNATESLLNYEYEELINAPISRIIPKAYLKNNISKSNLLKEFDITNISFEKNELICKTKTNSKFPIELTFSKWDNKGKEYTTVIIRDISKRVEIARQYKELFNEMLDGFALYEIVLDESRNLSDLTYIAANRAYEKLTHRKLTELIGKTFSEINPTLINKRLPIYERVVKSGKPTTFEESGILLGHHFQITVYSPNDKQIATIITDITVRKKAEEILMRDQQTLARKVQERTEELEKISIFNKTIIDHADIAIISTDKHGVIASINPYAEVLLGYKSSEVVGKNRLIDIFREENGDLLSHETKFDFRYIAKKIATQKIVEEIIVRNKYKKTIPLLVSYNILRNKIGKIDGFVFVSTDITQLKESEESLRKSQMELMIRESYLLSMVENHPGRFWLRDKSGKYIFSNERNNKFVRLTTGFEEEILGAQISDIFNRQEALNLIKSDQEVLRTKRPIIREIEQIVGSRNMIFEKHNFPVFLPNGEVIGVAGFATDITERKNQELQLRMQSEAFESFSVSLVISDSNGNILWANKAFERLTGYTVSEAIGKNANILGSGHMPHEFFENLWKTIRSGKVWTGEFINRMKDGTLYYEESTITPIKNEKGEISRFVALKIDITHRKEIERALKLSEERWQFAIEASGDGVWDYNFSTDIEFFSRRWKEMLGYEEHEISTNKFEWESRVHPEDWTQSQQDMQSHFDGKTPFYINEHRMLCKDGTYKWMLSRGKLIERGENGAPLRMIGTQTDISEIKNLEESLKQNIEKEKELNEMKSRFVSTASHEFRTPLASILITTDSLLNYWTKMGEEQIFSKFEKIRSNVVHLTNIVSDVLQISKIQEGRIEIKPVKLDIIELCQNIINGFREENSRFRIEIQTVFNSFYMYLDERLIRQALNNLISNAIKYSPKSDRIDIIINHTMDEVTISVIDQGIGIPLADQKNLFTPFYRASNTRHIQGNGLGLNIIRESVKLHGGDLTYKSVENEGSRFTLHLPTKISLLKKDSDL